MHPLQYHKLGFYKQLSVLTKSPSQLLCYLTSILVTYICLSTASPTFLLPTQAFTSSWAGTCLFIYYPSLAFFSKCDPQPNEITMWNGRESMYDLGLGSDKSMVQRVLPATRNKSMYKISKYSVF